MTPDDTPKPYRIRPCTVVYIALMLLTLATWLIGKLGYSGLQVSLVVLGFALFKGFLIGDYYMGLRGIKSIWRWVIVLWLLIPGILITVAFSTAA
ncbi:MAG TPA: O-succinylhomoserine sulfhydrylase [Gammaproteobacteria bacterium]|nr:O-succinylhomoserine sulfhydrylase [Gammaproteobacteria bacterium]